MAKRSAKSIFSVLGSLRSAGFTPRDIKELARQACESAISIANAPTPSEKLAENSREATLAGVSPSEKLAEMSREAASELRLLLPTGHGVLSPRVARIFRDSMKDIDIGTLPSSSATLTKREAKILEVIGRGAKGMTYCRELHSAGLRPRRAWREAGCPTSYPEAYRDGHWRQMIQDEKSKVWSKSAKITSNH